MKGWKISYLPGNGRTIWFAALGSTGEGGLDEFTVRATARPGTPGFHAYCRGAKASPTQIQHIRRGAAVILTVDMMDGHRDPDGIIIASEQIVTSVMVPSRCPKHPADPIADLILSLEQDERIHPSCPRHAKRVLTLDAVARTLGIGVRPCSTAEQRAI